MYTRRLGRQADWQLGAPKEVPFKDIGSSGTRYTANNGAAFAEAVLRTVFGYRPPVIRQKQQQYNDPVGGRLHPVGSALTKRVAMEDVRVRLHIIRNVRIENSGKYQSCMVSKLRIICKQTEALLWAAAETRGLSAKLCNLRLPNASLVNVCSDPTAGLSFC